MKVVVIGSNSFSGSNFINLLLKRGFEVLAISRSNEYHEVFLPYKWNKANQSNITFYKMDVNKDLNDIIEKIRSFRPKFAVNFAAQGMVAESWLKPEDWYQTNVVSQVKLHNQLRQFDFIENYLHFSTPEVYGSTDGWIKESYDFAPNTPYAASRAACDLHLMTFFRNYNFPLTFTRAANVFGEGQQLYRIITKTILCGLTGSKLNLHGGGVSERSFIHIDDVSEATFQVMIKGTLGETYHISTNEKISIKDLVWKVFDQLSLEPENFVDISDERLGKDHSYALDSSKIRTELSWNDHISLEDGIERTIDWVNLNLDILKKMPFEYIHKS
jgi:dTDP-glucose 4,6-dehydratase